MPPITSNQFDELKEMLKEIAERPHTCEKVEDIAAIQKTQAVIIEQLRFITETNEKVVNTLYGNGKPGLTTITSENKKNIDSIIAIGKSILYTLLGLGITALFYLILNHGIIK